MKKIYGIIFALIFSFNLSAEEVLNETFDSWPPDGWSIIEGPGSVYYSHWWHREESVACVFVTGDNQDEWLITPQLTLPEEGEIRLSADMMGAPYRMITMDYGDFFVNVSTDDGQTWETIWVEDDEEIVEASGVDFPWQHNEWFYPSININDYAGQTVKFAFRYVAPDGDADWWNLDNVIIKSLVENEVILEEFVFPEYGLLNDEFSFEGSFRNLGENDVTSFEVVYTVDGVESVPYLIDNVAIPYNTTYEFTHDIPYMFAEAELFELTLNISKVNGVEDPLPGNNIINKDISIATGTVSRKPFFEVFTSSTCPACPGTNETVDAVLANNIGNYSLVKYQVYWPGAGDPYYIIDDSIRSNYYEVGGVPDFYSNGVFDDGYSFNQSDFNAAANEGAFAEMEMSYSFSGINVSVDVSLTPTINILDASIHIAIVEKTTYNNVGNNGETEFHNVLMKMLPGPYGTNVTLEPGVQVNVSETGNLIETFIEEFEDLQVVVWVQDNETRYIMQSESSDLVVGIENQTVQNFQLYPNPAKEAFNINSISDGNLKMYDVHGKLISDEILKEGANTIGIADIPKGIYILKVITNDFSIETHKIVKK